jgi:hypothetical protein
MGNIEGVIQQVLSSTALKESLVSMLEEKLPLLVKDLVTRLVKEEVGKLLPSRSDRVPSFADILREGKGSVSQIASLVRREEEAHEEKKDRLIVRGLKLDEKDESGDEQVVRAVAEELGVSIDGVRLEVKRVGKGDRPPLVSVKLPSHQRLQLLREAKNLRQKEHYKEVYINPDRTPGEMHADYLLRCELRKQKQDHPDRSWMIRRGAVVERDFPPRPTGTTD